MSRRVSDDLIINARSQLSWQHRLTTDICTAAMWAAWLLLWRPLLGLLVWLHGLGFVTSPASRKLAASFGVVSFDGLLVLAAAACVLMLWPLLPTLRARAAPQSDSLRDCAGHFGLPEQDIRSGREASVCVVHHDEDGRVLRVEVRDTARELSGAA